MDTVTLLALIGLLVLLILLSAFFSGSETAMVSLNRYRLKTLAQSGDKRAQVALDLLARPERLLGTILLGNNLVNMAAASVTTVIALKMFGDAAIAVATFLITIIILVFAEVPPKTYAALNPEKIAFPAIYILNFLVKILSPVVKAINLAGNGLLKLIGVSLDTEDEHLSPEELRTVVLESGNLIPKPHQEMLLRILELENITVEDVMVPRSQIEAIDLEDDWDDIVIQLSNSPHTRIPVYEGTLDNIVGLIHVRKLLYLIHTEKLDKESFREVLRKPFYIPEGSKLSEQLLGLQSNRRQTGLVVDEYGDITGLITVEEILEEIVGEFTELIPGQDMEIHVEEDGNLIVPGNANIRELNRKMDWQLSTDGPKTLNGLILETMENIPATGTTFELEGLKMQILQAQETAVVVVRIFK